MSGLSWDKGHGPQEMSVYCKGKDHTLSGKEKKNLLAMAIFSNSWLKLCDLA